MKLSASNISGEDFEIGATCASQLNIEIDNLDDGLCDVPFQDKTATAPIALLHIITI
jgi:hypothetical protein